MSGVDDIGEFYKMTVDDICTIGENFKRQLHGLFKDTVLPATDPAVLDRLTKASTYFQDKITTIVLPYFESIQIDTDNKEIRKKIKNTIKKII